MNKIIGLDVSKNWLDICVYNTSDKPKYHYKTRYMVELSTPSITGGSVQKTV
ncbi:MAG: hypothetical protein DMENIID0002_05790 [Rickettsia endosymbiont of Sergentomyia squamirostris]|uniref:IS110 family transposase n=1 Tax=Candidatus Tisiphia endosymbiont of Sergentomyia squamirostris TaxID=3113639 RepID=A0AAT9G7Y1_9RICK